MDTPLLVNRDHPLPDGYVPDLVELAGRPGMLCDRHCAQAATRFVTAAESAGFHPKIMSAYRDRKQQEKCLGSKVNKFWVNGTTLEEALAQARRYVAAPGTSEHQTGLALDIKDGDYTSRTAGTDNSPGQKWLLAHCHEFGFILRYPPNKEHVTHVAFEPCHFRYVGESHAVRIAEQGLALEEYLR